MSHWQARFKAALSAGRQLKKPTAAATVAAVVLLTLMAAVLSGTLDHSGAGGAIVAWPGELVGGALVGQPGNGGQVQGTATEKPAGAPAKSGKQEPGHVSTGAAIDTPPIIHRPAAVMGFYTDDEPGLPGSHATAVRHADQLTYVCPFWYRVGFDGDGRIAPYGPGYDEAAARAATRELQARGVKVLGLIHNMRLGAKENTREIFHVILTDEARRGALVANIVALVEDMGFDGVNLDTEFLYPADRHAFTAFVAELAVEMRARGLLITADVPAKTCDDPQNGWSGGFDLAALAPHLDVVAVMTYDEHGYVTEAGPVASIGWVRRVLDYTVGVVPREKILLGLAGHVFDWAEGSKYPRYLSYGRAVATAREAGSEVKWDDKSKSAYYTYRDPGTGERRDVWLENRWSYAYKLHLVQEYGLGGACLWRLGLEDPDLWTEVALRFTVTK